MPEVWLSRLSGIITNRSSVVENGMIKILWDFSIQTGHVIQHRRPDIVELYKTERKCHLIDIAVPGSKGLT